MSTDDKFVISLGELDLSSTSKFAIEAELELERLLKKGITTGLSSWLPTEKGSLPLVTNKLEENMRARSLETLSLLLVSSNEVIRIAAERELKRRMR